MIPVSHFVNSLNIFFLFFSPPRFPDCWVPESQVQEMYKRVIPLTSLPQDTAATLHSSFYRRHRYRKHRRKWWIHLTGIKSAFDLTNSSSRHRSTTLNPPSLSLSLFLSLPSFFWLTNCWLSVSTFAVQNEIWMEIFFFSFFFSSIFSAFLELTGLLSRFKRMMTVIWRKVRPVLMKNRSHCLACLDWNACRRRNASGQRP